MKRRPEDTRALFIGGGIAALAGAVYLVRDAGVPGRNIRILDEGSRPGGSLDASGNADSGYVIRGGRMFEPQFVNTWDLLSTVRAPGFPERTVTEDSFEFYKAMSKDATTRLVNADGQILPSTLGLDRAERRQLMLLLATPEILLGDRTIQDWFHASFFRTRFWLMWCTMFAFEPWHCAAEMRRYMKRFIHLFPQLTRMTCIYHTRYTQHYSMVVPLMDWLIERGVRFEGDTRVTDIEFLPGADQVTARSIRYIRDGAECDDLVGPDDLVVFTNGSMTSNSTRGSMDEPAGIDRGQPGGSWALWDRIASGRPAFGNPRVFCNDIDRTKWLSFLVTSKDPDFRAAIEAWTGRAIGRAGLATFTDSSWLLSFYFHCNPAVPGQPDDTYLWWGYGLYPDRIGDHVKKKMSDCSGRDLVIESLHHLHMSDRIPSVLARSVCIPTMMPYITAQFMPRKKGDRPAVLPEGSTNFAFVGQFCELPEDVVFTVEYSVRSARVAVTGLMGLDREVPPVHRGWLDPRVLARASRTLMQ